jgi:hypothetical protein
MRKAETYATYLGTGPLPVPPPPPSDHWRPTYRLALVITDLVNINI